MSLWRSGVSIVLSPVSDGRILPSTIHSLMRRCQTMSAEARDVAFVRNAKVPHRRRSGRLKKCTGCPKRHPKGTREPHTVKGMARTAELSGAVVAVSINGRGAAWCDGIFSGDQEIVEAAKRAVLIDQEVTVFGCDIIARDDDPVGAAAALAAYLPGRAIFTENPPEVTAIFDAGMSWDRPEDWS